jgi:hypothetical protein
MLSSVFPPDAVLVFVLKDRYNHVRKDGTVPSQPPAAPSLAQYGRLVGYLQWRARPVRKSSYMEHDGYS